MEVPPAEQKEPMSPFEEEVIQILQQWGTKYLRR